MRRLLGPGLNGYPCQSMQPIKGLPYNQKRAPQQVLSLPFAPRYCLACASGLARDVSKGLSAGWRGLWGCFFYRDMPQCLIKSCNLNGLDTRLEIRNQRVCDSYPRTGSGSINHSLFLLSALCYDGPKLRYHIQAMSPVICIDIRGFRHESFENYQASVY